MLGCGATARVTDATASTYFREDTDRLSVRTPRVAIAGRIDDATLSGAYALDAWSGASIDIRTAASPHVEEFRHQVDLVVGHEGEDFRLRGAYRLSVENDYLSNGGSLRAEVDLAARTTTLTLDVYGGGDDVGRAGDASFHRLQGRVGARLGWTQVLDPLTVVSASWETSVVLGYQASPYRFVALGGDGTCVAAPFCVPEAVPDERIRHALSLVGRRALGDAISVGLEYRLYVDSWELVSHAAAADLAWRVDPTLTLGIAYRYYTQSEASFYRPRYFDADGSDGFWTRDRKLSALFTHAVTLSAEHVAALNREVDLTVGARVTGTRFEHLAFVGLSDVYALEITLLSGTRFR